MNKAGNPVKDINRRDFLRSAAASLAFMGSGCSPNTSSSPVFSPNLNIRAGNPAVLVIGNSMLSLGKLSEIFSSFSLAQDYAPWQQSAPLQPTEIISNSNGENPCMVVAGSGSGFYTLGDGSDSLSTYRNQLNTGLEILRNGKISREQTIVIFGGAENDFKTTGRIEECLKEAGSLLELALSAGVASVGFTTGVGVNLSKIAEQGPLFPITTDQAANIANQLYGYEQGLNQLAGSTVIDFTGLRTNPQDPTTIPLNCTVDGIHPSISTQRYMAESIAKYLNTIGGVFENNPLLVAA